MNLKNFIIGSIEKDDATDKLIYHVKDLNDPISEIEIIERGKKYPSRFLYDILMDNGYIYFKDYETDNYDDDLINEFCPLIFMAVIDDGGKFQKNKRDFIYAQDLIIIPNLEVRQNAKIINELKKLNDGNDF